MFSGFFIFLFSIFTVEYITLILLAYFCFRKKTRSSIPLGFVFIFIIFSILSYVHGYSTESIKRASIFYMGYFISMTLILNSFFFFALEFSGYKLKKLTFIFSLIATALDISTIIFLTCKSSLFSLNKLYSEGRYIFTIDSLHWYFNVHLGICYIYCICTLCPLIFKICSSPKHHRARYINIIFIFISVLLVNAAFLLIQLPFDITNYLYGVSAILIYLSCFKFTSHKYLLSSLQKVGNDSNNMIILFSENHNCIWFNSAVKNYFNEEKDLQNFLEVTFKKWRETSPLFEDTENDFTWRIKNTKDNETKDLQLTFHKNRDEMNNYIGCYFIVKDITEQLKKEEEQKKLLGTDKLTGLPNRDFYFNEVRKILRTNQQKTYLLICCNIIDFKIFNNIFGEEAGNKVLQTNASFIASRRDAAEACGRISGDMFSILLDEEIYHDEPFLDVMYKMEEEFSNAFYHLHMQMGIYRIENIQEPVSSMCEKAILAMKISKTDINHYVNWYKEDNLNKNLDEKMVIGKFEQSLKDGEFKMFLQPQVTKDNQVLGAEALARWIDIDGNIITPDRFIPVLENNGLVSKLDRFLWEEAAKQLERWKKNGREDLHISVNISVKDFYHEDLYRVFTDLVEKYNINPKNLKLEITETAIISDTFAINNLLQKLRQFGFEIELDDFGSGYSSLGLLKDVSVDALKIDMSFLHRSSETEDEKSWLVLNEIARLAQVLGMDTVVEGVEEQEQVEKLSSFGCKVFQGFYFARPGSITSFEERVHII